MTAKTCSIGRWSAIPSSACRAREPGRHLFHEEDFADALDGYRDALAHYPPEANHHLARSLAKIGNCHNLQGRPLAAMGGLDNGRNCSISFQGGR